MAKQLRITAAIKMMLDGAIARYTEIHGRSQWVLSYGIGESKPCSVAIKTLAARAWLWMNQNEDGFVTAGLNKTGIAKGKLASGWFERHRT